MLNENFYIITFPVDNTNYIDSETTSKRCTGVQVTFITLDKNYVVFTHNPIYKHKIRCI